MKSTPDTARPSDATAPNTPSPPSGPMTRARAKAIQEKVTSLLTTLDLDTSLDGMLLTADTLCVIRYLPQEPLLETQEDEMLSRQEEQNEAVTTWPVLPLQEPSGTTADSGTTALKTAVLPPTKIPEGGHTTTAPETPQHYRCSGTTALKSVVLPPDGGTEGKPEKSSGESTQKCGTTA